LGGGFRFYLRRVHSPAQRGRGQFPYSATKAHLVIAVSQEAGHLLGRQQRLAVHQHYMAAHAQARRRSRQIGGFGKGASARHQRSRGHNAMLVRLHHGAIYARGQTKIIGIDD
jgi:hypothetical protein